MELSVSSVDRSALKPGVLVPELVRTIRLLDMVAYAGATWDWHRLHYDNDFVSSSGLPGPVIDGQEFGALLAESLFEWLGSRIFISKLSFRFKEMAFAGDTVVCAGVIEKFDGTTLICTHTVSVGDRIIVASASSEVLFR
jgi:acyl dehydratase